MAAESILTKDSTVESGERRTVIQGELVRKSLHMLIALVPGIALSIGVFPTLMLLATGVLFYTTAEHLRLSGQYVALISTVTVLASRTRDQGRFVAGPVTLGVGAMLALLLYPAPAAFLGIYALAFGDGLASLVGKAFGSVMILPDASLEGSLACLVAVFSASLALSGRFVESLVIAVAATVLEALPTDDLDNIIIPVGVALLGSLLLF